MYYVVCTGLFNQLARELPVGDFKRALRNFVKAVQAVLTKNFEHSMVEIASQLHELVSAVLLATPLEKKDNKDDVLLSKILGTISPSLAQWGTVWTTLRDVEQFLTLRLAFTL